MWRLFLKVAPPPWGLMVRAPTGFCGGAGFLSPTGVATDWCQPIVGLARIVSTLGKPTKPAGIRPFEKDMLAPLAAIHVFPVGLVPVQSAVEVKAFQDELDSGCNRRRVRRRLDALYHLRHPIGKKPAR